MITNAYRIVLFLAFGILSYRLHAQSADEAAVTAVVNRLFDGMRKSDTAAIRATFAASPILQSVARSREGKTVVLTEPLDSFLIAIGHPHDQVYDERIQITTIRIDGDLATVWAPYSFYLGSQFSHCGVDDFQLVRINGEWKIQYLIDTRRKEGCE